MVKKSVESVNRFIQSLKSLFNYLTTKSEDEAGECLFVMSWQKLKPFENLSLQQHIVQKEITAGFFEEVNGCITLIC